MADQPFDELRFAVPVVAAVGAAPRPQSLDAWPDDRVPRTIGFRITLTESALELCRQGRAVAYFPDFVVDLYNRTVGKAHRLVRIPDPLDLPQIEQPVFMIVRSGEPHPHGRDLVQNVLGGRVGVV